jgi:hypothetical protein
MFTQLWNVCQNVPTVSPNDTLERARSLSHPQNEVCSRMIRRCVYPRAFTYSLDAPPHPARVPFRAVPFPPSRLAPPPFSPANHHRRFPPIKAAADYDGDDIVEAVLHPLPATTSYKKV